MWLQLAHYPAAQYLMAFILVESVTFMLGSRTTLSTGVMLECAARATELTLKEVLYIQTTPEGDQLNWDEGHKMPSC